MSDVATEVRRRGGHRCEYCLIPQALFQRRFHIEHIVAKQHGGLTRLDNLALACWQCNLKKGPNLSGIDPETGQITGLFQPRVHAWAEHFVFREPRFKVGKIEIAGLTRSVGRRYAYSNSMRSFDRPSAMKSTEALYN